MAKARGNGFKKEQQFNEMEEGGKNRGLGGDSHKKRRNEKKNSQSDYTAIIYWRNVQAFE